MREVTKIGRRFWRGCQNSRALQVFWVACVAMIATQSLAWGATYYVRADGTAGDKLESVGCSSPADAMNLTTYSWQNYSPGDTIVVCGEGGVFRANFGIHFDGVAGSPITIDGRGSAVVTGSDLVGGWSSVGGNVYVANLSTEPRQVFVNGSFGNRQSGLAGVASNQDWYWQSNQLYLYSPSGDPDQVFNNPGVEASRRTMCVDIQGHDHIRITGITAQHSNSNGISAWNPGSHVTVDNSLAEWNWHNGIGFNGNAEYDSFVIQDNVVRYNGTGGIGFLGPGRDSIIRRNLCYSNGKFQSAEYQFDYQHRWTYGIKLWEGTALQEGNNIYHNKCYDNGRGHQGDYQGRGAGIWVDMVRGNPANPILIHHNFVYENKGNGVFIEISSNTATFGNVLYNNATNVAGSNNIFAPANIVIDARGDWETVNNLVYNNTVVGGRQGIKVVSYEQTSGCTISNNIVKNNIVVGASEHNLYCNTGGDNDGVYGTGNVYSNNNFGQESYEFVSWDGDDHDTYAAWESNYGESSESIEADPQFADYSRDGLYLMAGSPCRNTGVNLGSDFDLALLESSTWVDNVTTSEQGLHGSGWEVGAYVYSGTANMLFIDGFETGDALQWSSIGY